MVGFDPDQPYHEWTDGPTCGKKLVLALTKNVIEDHHPPPPAPDDLKVMERGALKSWDIQKLCNILTTIYTHHNFTPHHLTEDETRQMRSSVKQFLYVRNRQAHIGRRLLGSKEFLNLWRKGTRALISLGGNTEELRKLQNCANIGDLDLTPGNHDDRTVRLQKTPEDDGPADIKLKVELANRYLNGMDGVPMSRKKAFELFSLADKAGNPQATFLLGTMYQSGEGVRRDEFRARELFEKASTHLPFESPGVRNVGVAEALNALGLCCQNGRGGVQKNFSAAADLYKKSIDGGEVTGEAAFNLASLHKRGQGVVKSMEMAVQYLEKAAGQGSVLAMKKLAVHYTKIGNDEKSRFWTNNCSTVEADKADTLRMGSAGSKREEGRHQNDQQAMRSHDRIGKGDKDGENRRDGSREEGQNSNCFKQFCCGLLMWC